MCAVNSVHIHNIHSGNCNTSRIPQSDPMSVSGSGDVIRSMKLLFPVNRFVGKLLNSDCDVTSVCEYEECDIMFLLK